jgi:hypothetical protein
MLNCLISTGPSLPVHHTRESSLAKSMEVIALKNASDAGSLIITGGTEVGHAGSQFSHPNGFKVDVRHTAVLDIYIVYIFTRIANRGGSPSGKLPAAIYIA